MNRKMNIPGALMNNNTQAEFDRALNRKSKRRLVLTLSAATVSPLSSDLGHFSLSQTTYLPLTETMGFTLGSSTKTFLTSFLGRIAETTTTAKLIRNAMMPDVNAVIDLAEKGLLRPEEYECIRMCSVKARKNFVFFMDCIMTQLRNYAKSDPTFGKKKIDRLNDLEKKLEEFVQSEIPEKITSSNLLSTVDRFLAMSVGLVRKMLSIEVPKELKFDFLTQMTDFLFNQVSYTIMDIYKVIEPDRFDAICEYYFLLLHLDAFMGIGVECSKIICSVGRQDIVHRILLAIINSKNSEVIDKWKLLGQYNAVFSQDINHIAYPNATWLIGMIHAAEDSTLPPSPSSNLSHTTPADNNKKQANISLDNNNNLSCVIVGDISDNSEDDVYFSCRSDLSKSPSQSAEDDVVKNQMPEQKRTSDARTIDVKDKITPTQSKRLCKAVTGNQLCNKSRGILSSLRNRLSSCLKCRA